MFPHVSTILSKRGEGSLYAVTSSLDAWSHVPSKGVSVSGLLFLLGWVSVQRSLSRKGLPVETPLELEKRAVCIPLECFLAMRKFEGLRFGCIYSSSERLVYFSGCPSRRDTTWRAVRWTKLTRRWKESPGTTVGRCRWDAWWTRRTRPTPRYVQPRAVLRLP